MTATYRSATGDWRAQGSTIAEFLDGTSNTILLSETVAVSENDDSRGAWGLAGAASFNALIGSGRSPNPGHPINGLTGADNGDYCTPNEGTSDEGDDPNCDDIPLWCGSNAGLPGAKCSPLDRRTFRQAKGVIASVGISQGVDFPGKSTFPANDRRAPDILDNAVRTRWFLQSLQ